MTNVDKRRVALYIHRIDSRCVNRIIVDGAVTDDVLRIDDLFKVVYRKTFPKTMEGFAEDRPQVAQRHVSLRVRSMMAYNRVWEELHSGMTGRFELEGVGGDLVMENDILGSSFEAS